MGFVVCLRFGFLFEGVVGAVSVVSWIWRVLSIGFGVLLWWDGSRFGGAFCG